ncbi:TetR/AcrR family transcriptional regulator [Actinoplanes sp. NPDC049316]|uniref:TetR/AcrR family transcriptional regulator n=1 Tax=Actinoplanes sp. NPDC049316 TaxID=3154727 RepID=UPI0034358A3E
MSPSDRRPTARDKILETAFRLFYERGPRGAGIDTVVAESGVAKTTLYKYFPRKDDLVLAYLDEVDHTWFGSLRAAARAAGDDPREQLVGMFDALGSACRREGYHGCAFINTAAESEPGSAVHRRTVEHKAVVRAWVTDLARRAGAADAQLLGRQLTTLLDGGLAGGVLDADPAIPAAAKAAARALVDAACPSPRVGEMRPRAFGPSGEAS